MKIKSSWGFTLIELIVVIVILGILAAVAAPKFMDLQGDAKASAIKGMEAALKSMDQLVYSKAVIEVKETQASTTITIDSEEIPLTKGHVIAEKLQFEEYMKILLDVDSDNEWKVCFFSWGIADGKTWPNGVTHSKESTWFFIPDSNKNRCGQYMESSGGTCAVYYEQYDTTGETAVKSITSGC